MNSFSKLLVIAVIAAVILAVALWFLWTKAPLEPVFSDVTATVKFISLEGGFYGLEGDDGKKYDPINLSNEFRQDGLRVMFSAKSREDIIGIHMWGNIIEITKIEKI